MVKQKCKCGRLVIADYQMINYALTFWRFLCKCGRRTWWMSSLAEAAEAFRGEVKTDLFHQVCGLNPESQGNMDRAQETKMFGETFFLEVGVPEEKLEECYQWAFGVDYVNIPATDWDAKWCELHGDLFMTKGSDLVTEVFLKIGKAFLSRA